jgi:hypothetical protein
MTIFSTSVWAQMEAMRGEAMTRTTLSYRHSMMRQTISLNT